MRRILMTITLISLFIIAKAQQSDTTRTEPPQQPVPTDTVRQEPTNVPDQTPQQTQPQPQPRQTQPQTTDPKEGESQPRIIYYQSSGSDKPYESKYRSRYNKRNDIKTLAGSMNHSGGFGALSFRITDFEDEAMVMAGVRAGWIINRTLGIGFEGHGIIPTAQLSGIDPVQDVVALGGYGGMFLELILFSNQVVHLTFPASAGAGWIGYTDDWENVNNTNTSGIIDEDIFWYVEPGANVEINISRNFRLAAGMSQRFTQDMELLNTSSDALEKRNYYVTLKIGGF
jgi:hypothetical protein